MTLLHSLSLALLNLRNFAEKPVGLLTSSLGTLGAGTISWLQWIGANAAGITVLCSLVGLGFSAYLNLQKNQRDRQESIERILERRREHEARMRREQIEHEARVDRWKPRDR